MASRPRRSSMVRGDIHLNSPMNNGRTTRRNSNISTSADSNAQLNSLEDIYENDPATKKKEEKKHRKNLTTKDISQVLDSSDEEIYSPPTKTTGAKEEKTSNKSNETPKKVRCTLGKLKSLNEDDLMKEHELECRKKDSTPSRKNRNDTPQVSKKVVETSPRKRSKQNNYQKETNEDGADENEMSQANHISSPPKRLKSETEIGHTPKKKSELPDVKTPRSAAKRKLSLASEPKNEDHDSKVRTRSKKNNDSVNYREWSSSEASDKEGKRLKEPKVILTKLDPTKKNSRKSSKISQRHESEESETENRMNNANKKSNQKNSKSKSKSMLKLEKDSETTPYSPSKAMQDLSIGTPKKSDGPLVVRFKRSLIDTPSNTPISDADKKYLTRRTSQRNPEAPSKYREKSSDDEDKDSSDDYKAEEESSDSDDISDESGQDSEEEFEAFARKKNKARQTSRKTPATPKSHKRLSKVSMNTPTKAIARMSLSTPSFKHERLSSVSKPTTPLQKARATLHVSVLPKSLPCREEQFNDIYSFLHARLSDGSGGCIYISGVPGTGKTATVSEVIRCLKKSMTKGELDEFDYIDINGMKLAEPRQAYVQIWKQMTGETKTWEESHKLLNKKFTNATSKQRMTLLLVDELDLLCTKRQDVVYNLLDWPSKTNAKLVVVTIANTMDLPERILMGKVTSRLGLTRLTFPPYNFKQLEEIVVSRLKGANAFGGETIQLVARKVASVSGDARRALDICRRSAEIAEKNNRELVSMADVKQALDQMIANPKIQAIKHCSEYEQYFLRAVCTEVQRTGIEEVVFKNVYMQLETLCRLDGEETPNVSEALEICARLGAWRLLICDHSRMDIHQRLLLNVSTDDVYFATKNQ